MLVRLLLARSAYKSPTNNNFTRWMKSSNVFTLPDVMLTSHGIPQACWNVIIEHPFLGCCWTSRCIVCSQTLSCVAVTVGKGSGYAGLVKVEEKLQVGWFWPPQMPHLLWPCICTYFKVLQVLHFTQSLCRLELLSSWRSPSLNRPTLVLPVQYFTVYSEKHFPSYLHTLKNIWTRRKGPWGNLWWVNG